MADEKIKANEVLDEKELDQAAGGFAIESREDMSNLNLGSNYNDNVRQLEKDYARAGVQFQARNNAPNQYHDMKTGEKLDHGTAFDALTGRKS